MIKTTLKSYRKKTKKSSNLFKKSKELHVNGVHHNIRFFEPYPFIVKASSGKFLVDVDSNKYVDYWMGHWSLILGHSPKDVKTNVRIQLENGWMHGTASKNSIELSETISKAVPVAEKIRYVSTGTEATMYAIRLARTATKRKTIAKVDGGWHGYTTDLLKTVNWPFNKSESSGLLDEKYITSLPFNDIVTLGKIVGGGFPIGIISGKNEFMNYANTSIFSKSDRAYIGGGTFSANPLSMIAGNSTLSTIKKKGSRLYQKLNDFGSETRKMLDKKFAGSVITTGMGSLFLTHFLNTKVYEINNAADVAKCNIKKLHDYHFHMIANNGIFFLPGKLGAFSDAHTKSDIKTIAKSTDQFLTTFKK
jgi:glutamate-1-semialdehyde aminotransferase